MRESPACFSYPFSAYTGLFWPIFANKFAYVQKKQYLRTSALLFPPLSPSLNKNSPVATFASCGAYANERFFASRVVPPLRIIKEPKFYLREYMPHRDRSFRAGGTDGRARWGRAVSEGHIFHAVPYGSLIIAVFIPPSIKIAQKFAYVQFLLYLCSRKLQRYLWNRQKTRVLTLS